MVVRPGFCGTLSGTPKTGSLVTRLICIFLSRNKHLIWSSVLMLEDRTRHVEKQNEKEKGLCFEIYFSRILPIQEKLSPLKNSN